MKCGRGGMRWRWSGSKCGLRQNAGRMVGTEMSCGDGRRGWSGPKPGPRQNAGRMVGIEMRSETKRKAAGWFETGLAESDSKWRGRSDSKRDRGRWVRPKCEHAGDDSRWSDSTRVVAMATALRSAEGSEPALKCGEAKIPNLP